MEVQIGQTLTVKEAFRLALSEARKGHGFVSPNPPVGCVFLDAENRLLSLGHHRRFGGPHAEVEAFNQIKDSSRFKGAKAIVTLEPCSHFGKTPPCADLLSSLPLAEVHYGVMDPNPLVSGKGLNKIKAAGIRVVPAPQELEEELEEAAEMFLHFQRVKECFVGLKIASSLDGQMCLANGDSQWITGEQAREQVHFLRAYYGAVLTTAVSVMKDNSRLNARLPAFQKKSIPVFIVDESARSSEFLQASALLKARDPKDVFIFTGQEHLHRWPFLSEEQIIALPKAGECLDLSRMFAEISSRGHLSVMVEAGPTFSSAVFHQGLFHRLELFLGNKILGTNGRGSWTKGLGFQKMEETLHLEALHFRTFGQDLWVSGRNPQSFRALFHQGRKS